MAELHSEQDTANTETPLRTSSNSRIFAWSAGTSRPGLATDSRVYGGIAVHLAEMPIDSFRRCLRSEVIGRRHRTPRCGRICGGRHQVCRSPVRLAGTGTGLSRRYPGAGALIPANRRSITAIISDCRNGFRRNASDGPTVLVSLSGLPLA